MKNELYHHGIKGQKWGIKNGPPYPLGTETSENSGKITAVNSKTKIKDIDSQKTEKGKKYVRNALIAAGVVTVAALAAYGVYKYSNSSKGEIGLSGKITDFLKSADLDETVKNWTDKNEAHSYNSEHLEDKGLINSLTGNEREGLERYTEGFYTHMNNLLRFPNEEKETLSKHSYLNEEICEKWIDGCTSALEKSSLKEDVFVHRGTHASAIANMLGIDEANLSDSNVLKNLKGMCYTDKGFHSTAGSIQDIVHNVSSKSSGSSLLDLHILCPKGTKAMYVNTISNGNSVSSIRDEHEFLIQRNTKFKIEDYMTNEAGKVTDLIVSVAEQILED